MLIMQVNNIQSTNFKAGLTKQILEKEVLINPKKVENYFKNSPYSNHCYDFRNIDLKNNKAYALAFRMCAEIFKNFSRKRKYNDSLYQTPKVFPNDIIVFNEKDLSDKLSSEDKKSYMSSFHAISNHVFRENGIFKNLKNDIRLGSILAPNVFDSLEKINEIADLTCNKQNHFHSSNHFLNLFIHEWVHSIEDYYMYHEFGSSGGCSYDATMRNRCLQQLNYNENEIVCDVLGEYAATPQKYQYDEVVAEAWTKFICSSLDKDGVHFKKDPVEEMKKTPKEFQKILKKVSTIELYKRNYFTGEDKPSQLKPICFYPVISKR